MSMILFDKSGTFNPADHGLTAGDLINVVCVGGGGGGAGVSGTNQAVTSSNTAAGGNGGTSSFGSLLSALGGSGAPAVNGVQDTQGSMQGGLPKHFDTNSPTAAMWGGGGATGFYPGTVLSIFQQSPSDTNVDGYTGKYVGRTGGGAGPSSTNGNINGIGGQGGQANCPPTNSIAYSGPGGAGYGAGGGGSCKKYSVNAGDYAYSWASFGGNAGEIKQLAHKLVNTNAVSVTIGAAGIGGGAALSSNGRTLGGDGASGCVLVFW